MWPAVFSWVVFDDVRYNLKTNKQVFIENPELVDGGWSEDTLIRRCSLNLCLLLPSLRSNTWEHTHTPSLSFVIWTGRQTLSRHS